MYFCLLYCSFRLQSLLFIYYGNKTMRVYAALCALLVAGCANLPPLDNYGMSWNPVGTPLPMVYQSVNDEVFFEVCQQSLQDADQACAIRDYVFRKNCTIVTRKNWRYNDMAGLMQHEQKHCDGYDHPQVYRNGVMHDYTRG